MRCRSTRPPTSSTSSARSRRYGSSRPRYASAVACAASPHAAAALAPPSIARRAGSSSAESSSSSRCASKIAASSAPASSAIRSRAASTSPRAAARARSNRAHSSSGVRGSVPPWGSRRVRGTVPPWGLRAGAMTMPAEAGMPRRTVPAVTGGDSGGGGGAGGSAGAGAPSSSPKPSSGELAQGGERLGGLGAARSQQDRVALPDRERDQGAEAAGVGRAAAGGLVGDRDGRVEPARGLDEAGRRAGVQAEAVGHFEPELEAAVDLRCSGDLRNLVDPELRRLHAQRGARLAGHLLERGAGPRAGGGRHRPLHDRRLAQQHAHVVDHLGRHLRAHHRAPEVHQHEHAVGARRGLDRLQHELHVGADLARRIGHAAGRLDRHLVAAHLPRQLDHAGSQRRAVRDDDEADHAQRPAARCRISTGCTVRTPVAFSMCHRHVSESHTASSGRASSICRNSPAPTSIAISYFSAFKP